MPREMRGHESRLYLRLSSVVVVSMAVALIMWVESQSANIGLNLPLAIGFAVAFFISRLLTVRLPQGDEVCVTLMVALVGLAFLDVTMLILASIVAGVVEGSARFSRSSRRQFHARMRDTFRGAILLAMLSPFQLVLHPLASSNTRSDLIVVLALVGGLSYAVVDILTAAIVQRIFSGTPFTRSAKSLIRSLATVYVVHWAMAAVVLRLQGVAGLWPFPVAILLTLILQNSFNLYIRIRCAYVETIRALAHAAELDRPHDSGHARRVADLSVAIGRRLGLSSEDLERLGYAALLHDVGRMGASGEDPKGDHVRRGAEIAESIPFLEGVAPLILWDPDNGHSPAKPPIGWSIVRTCSHYDRLRAELGAERALGELAKDPQALDARITECLEDIVRSKRIIDGASP